MSKVRLKDDPVVVVRKGGTVPAPSVRLEDVEEYFKSFGRIAQAHGRWLIEEVKRLRTLTGGLP